MRLGQLFLNLTRVGGLTIGDVWEVEDSAFERLLDQFLESGEWPQTEAPAELFW